MASPKQGTEPLNIQLLVDSIPALIHTSMPDGYLDYFNKPWLEYLGVSLEKVAGWNWTSFIHPEDVDGIVAEWRGCLASGEIFEYETRVRRADGEYRWMFHRKVPLRDGRGSIVKWYGSSLDIEERKTTEEQLHRNTDALQRSEFYLAEGQRLGHMGSWAFDPDGFSYWSPELFRMHGLEPAGQAPSVQEYLGLVHPQDQRAMAELINRLVAEDSPFDAIKRIVRPDGEVRYIRCAGVPFVESRSLKKYVGSAIDVTEHELLTQELRRREAYLAEAQRMSHTGSWAWSPDLSGDSCTSPNQDIKYWSEECYRVLGFDPQDGLPRFKEFFQRIHSDDQPGFRELIQTAIHEKAEWEADYRVVHPGGAIRDIHVVGHPILSTSGDLAEFVGTVIDVTERKRAEEVLRRSEMELRQIVDFAPQLIAVYGANMDRFYANRTALDYLGISLDEWRHKTFAHSTHPDDAERLKTASDRAISSGAAYEVELRLHKHDGSYRWFLARYNPVRDDKGQITRWYVTATDIEDRKQAEDRLQRENVALREEIDKTSMFEEIVGASPALRAVLSRVSKVAPTDSTVLITGETGTGKELVARAIHRRSRRCSRAFVSVNCAAIPRDLIASELFGHEKGAFTGALQRRVGRFELAEGGTIFLDEVGELPTETQIALLRVLQEREFDRVGGNHPIRADVRVIAATNRDLEASVAAGSFRGDLFYRINVFPIEIPPLRQRKDDIAVLVEYFIDRYARKTGKKIKAIEKNTLELLRSYAWPGNIRELQNIVERSVIVCETETFSVDQSWLSLHSAQPQPARAPLPHKSSAQDKQAIEAALAETEGRVSGSAGAAALLGVPASTLESKIRALKINKFRYKSA